MTLLNRQVRHWVFATLLALQGCQTPVMGLDSFASQNQLERTVIRKNGFDHLVFSKISSSITPSDSTLLPSAPVLSGRKTLHVYLEGDGSPWRHRVIVMPDPTPRNPLMLRLMSMDNAPSVYVGRPCYNGSSDDEGCNASLWTSARFSKTVVSSMASVINELVREHDKTAVTLIGHSGGGALAMLIAQRIPAVSHVVTIAGNLDTDAWTSHHGYTRLFNSLNPATQPPLRSSVQQWHLLGGNDTVIPPDLVKQFITSQLNALGVSVAAYGHVCCWENSWPQIARSIGAGAHGLLPGTRFKLPGDYSSLGIRR